MKTLIIVRHAKSSWDYAVDDKDRPLMERGINDAHRVSQHLKDTLPVPSAIFSSMANRALHTCMIFMRNLGLDYNDLQITPEMYDFSGGQVMQLLHGLGNSHDTVMVFGHNYALTSLFNALGDKHIDNLPTSGVAMIDFEVSTWSEIGVGTNKLLVFPKQLRK